MKKTFLIPLFCISTLTTLAQSARTVLDRTANRITQSGCIRATFNATSFSGTTEQGSTQGTLVIEGTKFYMSTAEVLTWFDGKTQWTKLTNNNEVNIAEPTIEEQQAVNPYTIINIYKKGYKLSVSKSTLRGKKTFCVRMKAKKKDMPYSDIIVDVTQDDYTPLCIRTRQNGDWGRLAILSFKPNQKVSPTTFTFPSDQYPDIDYIDLR
ncbi:MAG: hypothetical protein K6F94_03370 [Bacteroidaceae bacterium]|nr:hypothetical protein [Bacteroidaceae bacterium]